MKYGYIRKTVGGNISYDGGWENETEVKNAIEDMLAKNRLKVGDEFTIIKLIKEIRVDIIEKKYLIEKVVKK